MTNNAFEEQEYTKRFDSKIWRDLIRFAVPWKKHIIWLAVIGVFGFVWLRLIDWRRWENLEPKRT